MLEPAQIAGIQNLVASSAQMPQATFPFSTRAVPVFQLKSKLMEAGLDLTQVGTSMKWNRPSSNVSRTS